MTLLQSIQFICNNIKGYSFEFEEAMLMNVRADNKPFPSIYFEEYRNGRYNTRYGIERTTRIQLFFMDLSHVHSDANVRETIRERIEIEAIRPFIKAYNDSGLFKEVSEWKFSAPPPRFDVNEVSIMLDFDCTMLKECLK